MMAKPKQATIGPYVLSHRLGQGGAAVVYQGYDKANEREVALKVLKPDWANNERCRKRFAREAYCLRMLRDPGVPKFIELRRYKGTLVLVLEFVRGKTLEELIEEEGQVHYERCVPWFVALLETLQKIHHAGIIHRDIKPQNLVIGPSNEVKLLDFGLARLTGSTRLTMAGRTVGTPHYLSQEQARGRTVDARTDVYAVGVSLYRTLAGALPFQSKKTRKSLVRAIIFEDPTPLAEYLPDVDPDLEELVLRSLAKDPNKRFSNARDMQVALETWLSCAWLNDIDIKVRANPQRITPATRRTRVPVRPSTKRRAPLNARAPKRPAPRPRGPAPRPPQGRPPAPPRSGRPGDAESGMFWDKILKNLPGDDRPRS